MDKPAVASNSADAPYWEGLRQGRLSMQQCQRCATWHWPAVWRCGECGAWEPAWQDIALEGEVYSWQHTLHPFEGTEDIGVPYTTVLAALPQAGGRRLLGLFEGEYAQLATGVALSGSISETTIRGLTIPSLRWRIA
jgi:uncharacterized OB-fold protein